MNFHQLKRSVLENIAAHDGQWSWYQLDREILWKCPQLSQQLIPAINELEAAGLIRAVPKPDCPGMPTYWIAADGRLALRGIDAPPDAPGSNE